MWWAVWWAAVVACSVGAAAAPAPESMAMAPMPPLDFLQNDLPAPDDESVGYAVQSMGGRYPTGGASAPWLYLLADVPRDSQVTRSEIALRRRRGFSVNPAVEVLQKGAYSHYLGQLAHNNRNFLNCIGKRDPWNISDCKMKN